MSLDRRPAYKVADIQLAPLRPQGDPAGRARDARADVAARALPRAAPAGRRQGDGQPAHDGADRRADRDAHRTRRRRALGELQHLLDAGSGRRGGRRGTERHARESARRSGVRVEGRDARGVLVVHGRRAPVARRLRPRSDRRRRRRRHHADPQGPRVREGREGPRLQSRDRLRGMGRRARAAAPRAEAEPGSLHEDRASRPRRLRRDDDRRAPPLPDGEERHPALPRDQRQRFGHQEQVRQHLRLPPLAARRSDARERRDARRQGGGRVRLRRSRQGLRAGAARPGLPRDRRRDRPDLRAPGGDGRLRGEHARRRGRDRRHLHHRDGQLPHHHRRAHGAHEGQGDRRQHRALRQRDRHGRPAQAEAASAARTSSRSTTSGSSRTATACSCSPRAGSSISAARRATRAS